MEDTKPTTTTTCRFCGAPTRDGTDLHPGCRETLARYTSRAPAGDQLLSQLGMGSTAAQQTYESAAANLAA